MYVRFPVKILISGGLEKDKMGGCFPDLFGVKDCRTDKCRSIPYLVTEKFERSDGRPQSSLLFSIPR